MDYFIPLASSLSLLSPLSELTSGVSELSLSAGVLLLYGESVVYVSCEEQNEILRFYTVNAEKFARTYFSLIFANGLPREFKVLANKVSL